MIQSMKPKQSGVIYFLEVLTKDARLMTFKLNDPYRQHVSNLQTHLELKTRFNDLFAHKFFRETDIEKHYQGWKWFDIEKEYIRQGCDFEFSNDNNFHVAKDSRFRWRLVRNYNVHGGQKLCNSYPEKLMIPYNVRFFDLQNCIKFRSKNR